MKNNDQYSKYMNQVWDVKDKVYQATRNMTGNEYWAYIHQCCESFREKHKSKYVNPLSTADDPIKAARGLPPPKPSLSTKLLEERKKEFA